MSIHHHLQLQADKQLKTLGIGFKREGRKEPNSGGKPNGRTLLL
jgi:hypothetical protein